MNVKIDNESLNQIVLESGSKCLQLKQVSQRLGKLLPDRLTEITRRFRRFTSPGKAACRALADEAYVHHINELVDTKSAALAAHIHWETHRMLIDARKSLRTHHRAIPKNTNNPVNY